MDKMTLTKLAMQTMVWIEDTKYDIRQDWCSDESKKKLEQSLQLLRIIKQATEELRIQEEQHPQWNNITK
jgi:hypothetical protein